MCTDPERGGERPGSKLWSVGLDGLGRRSRLCGPSPAFAFTILRPYCGLRFHDSGCPFRPSSSRLCERISVFGICSVLAIVTFAPRYGVRLHHLEIDDGTS
jgi:hypothetical protein